MENERRMIPMVKGVARRVIMVKSPDPKLFEEAIFLVREEAFRSGSTDQVLREAEQAANRYLHHQTPRKLFFNLPLILWFLSGAALASLIWGFVLFIY
jgi:hypothetical protein